MISEPYASIWFPECPKYVIKILLISIVTEAMLLSSVPSFALYVNVSEPKLVASKVAILPDIETVPLFGLSTISKVRLSFSTSDPVKVISIDSP